MKKIIIILFIGLFPLSFLIDPNYFSILIQNLTPIRIGLLLFLVISTLYLTRYPLREVVGEYKALFVKPAPYRFISWACVFLIFIRLLSGVQAINHRDWLEMNVYWITLTWLFFQVVVLVKKGVLTSKLLEKAIWIWYVTGVLNGIVGLVQAIVFSGFGVKLLGIWGFRYPDMFRVTGFTNDPNHFGILSAILILMALHYYMSKKNSVHLFIIAEGILAILFAGSKSASIALFAGFILSIAFFLYKKIATRKSVIHVVLVLIISFIAYQIFSISVSPRCTQSVLACRFGISQNEEPEPDSSDPLHLVAEQTVNRAIAVGEGSHSTTAHIFLLRASLSLATTNPLVGVGYGNFGEALKANEDLYSQFNSIDPAVANSNDFPAHSMWGEVLSETGILALAGFMVLVISIIYQLLQKILLRQSVMITSLVLFIYITTLLFGIFFSVNEEFLWLLVIVGLLV